MALYQANLDRSVNCLKSLFRLYSVSNSMKVFVVRNEHLFMMIKIVFHSLHVFSLYVIVALTAETVPVQFFNVVTQHCFAPCTHLGLCTTLKRSCFCFTQGRRGGR